MPFTPALVGAGISGAVGIGTSLMQKGAVEKGQSAALAAEQQARDQARQDLAPWTGAGQNALMVAGNLAGANGPDAATAAMKDFYTSPGYQWRLEQGLRGVDAGAAAHGMLRSGATLQGEQAFGEGLAASEFSDYYKRLAGLSELGENAAAGTAKASMDAGKTMAGIDTDAANATSSIYSNIGKTLSTASNSLFSNPAFASWIGGGAASNNSNPGGGFRMT